MTSLTWDLVTLLPGNCFGDLIRAVTALNSHTVARSVATVATALLFVDGLTLRRILDVVGSVVVRVALLVYERHTFVLICGVIVFFAALDVVSLTFLLILSLVVSFVLGTIHI